MKEHYVSYECAQALKRLGFDKKVSAVWHFDGEEWNLIPDYGATFQHPKDIPHWNTSRMWGEYIYSAPRLDQAAAWLREVKGIDIEPRVWFVGNKREYRPYVMPPKCKDYIAYPPEESYEKALESGISMALELLGKEVKE